MNYQAIIRNFINCTPLQALELKERLSLSMSREAILYCANYYKNTAKRDPYIDEIKMLDQLSAALEKDAHSVSPVQFFTNDAFVAQTYADLLNKRAELYPNYTTPCTLGEAAELASAYLLRAEKKPPLKDVSLVPENVRENRFSVGADCVCPVGSTYRLQMLPYHSIAPVASDILVLLSPRQNQPTSQFAGLCDKLLQDERLMQHVKAVRTVRNDGVLRELLSMTNSVRIHLSAFALHGVAVPATVLCNAYGGCRILRIGAQSLSAVMQYMITRELQAFPFAQITSDQKFTLSRNQNESFALDPLFLRKLYHYKPTNAKLTDEKTLPPDPIQFGTANEASCKYLATGVNSCKGDLSYLNGMLAASATAAPKQTFFKTSLYTALIPVISLAVSGIPAATQGLSIALELPSDCNDPHVLGNCMATILGIYRAQIELGLPAQSVTVRSFEDVQSPTVTAFSIAHTEAIPECFTTPGNTVYCVSPAVDACGLPDFAALRQLLEQLVRLRRDGSITAFRVLINQSVTDGIRKMSTVHSCTLSDSRIASNGTLPFAILLESSRKLPLYQVGTVAQTGSTPFTLIEEATLPDRPTLVWSESPTLVLLSKKEDTDAAVLANVLKERGVDVLHFFGDEKELLPLSRAILGAQYLLLCKNATLPHTRQIDFALDTLRRADGSVLCFSEADRLDAHDLCLKNGIGDAFFEKIRN